MMPKFRGGSEDWLDDESSKRSPAKPSALAKAKPVPLSETNGTVAIVFPKLARVRWDDGSGEYLCSYRRATVFTSSEVGPRDRSPVAVGDRVVAEKTGAKTGLITGLAERRNQLSRPAPDRAETMLHVLVANIDQLVIVTAARNPDFSPGLVDRFLVAAQSQEIEPILCVNKVDLLDEAALEQSPWRLYRKLGINVIETSAKRDVHIAQLAHLLKGQATAFCGHSGVGKTSLLNAMLAAQVGGSPEQSAQSPGRVAEVSLLTGKGRHTTTGAILLQAPGNTTWIDTPGVREFGLTGIEPDDLKKYFPEFLGFPCAIPHCLHIDEQGCAVRELPRYSSYRRIYDSLKAGEG